MRHFAGEFYLSAYCIEDAGMAIFDKSAINLEHFQAALAFPLIYAPFKLGGKTYLEGAAKDTLNFKGLYEYRKDKRHPPINTIVTCDVLGMSELIGKPRNLYDAWVKSIIVPLVAIAEDDIKLFRDVHKPRIRERYGHREPKLLGIDFEAHVPKEHWPDVLDWSYSNLKTLYDVGYRSGLDFFDQHRVDLLPASRGPVQADPPMAEVPARAPSAGSGRHRVPRA